MNFEQTVIGFFTLIGKTLEIVRRDYEDRFVDYLLLIDKVEHKCRNEEEAIRVFEIMMNGLVAQSKERKGK